MVDVKKGDEKQATGIYFQREIHFQHSVNFPA